MSTAIYRNTDSVGSVFINAYYITMVELANPGERVTGMMINYLSNCCLGKEGMLAGRHLSTNRGIRHIFTPLSNVQ